MLMESRVFPTCSYILVFGVTRTHVGIYRSSSSPRRLLDCTRCHKNATENGLFFFFLSHFNYCYCRVGTTTIGACTLRRYNGIATFYFPSNDARCSLTGPGDWLYTTTQVAISFLISSLFFRFSLLHQWQRNRLRTSKGLFGNRAVLCIFKVGFLIAATTNDNIIL